MIKNKYLLPFIRDLINQLNQIKYFLKIDLRDTFYRIRVNPGDRWKMVFRTKYGHFKYTVMPFGFINTLVIFQAYIHKAFTGLLDIICVAYLNDILIFSRTEKEYRKHLRLILKRLRNTKLFAKLSKCFFFALK